MNIETVFNEIKDTLSNKKVLKHKLKKIEGKEKHKMEHTKSTKYRYRVLMINDLF